MTTPLEKTFTGVFRSRAGFCEGRLVVDVVIGDSAEITDVNAVRNGRNAAFHAAARPVGIDDAVRPDDVRRRQFRRFGRFDVVQRLPWRLRRGGNRLHLQIVDINDHLRLHVAVEIENDEIRLRVQWDAARKRQPPFVGAAQTAQMAVVSADRHLAVRPLLAEVNAATATGYGIEPAAELKDFATFYTDCDRFEIRAFLFAFIGDFQ